MLLDAWSLQALAAAGTAIAGECGRCAPPSHAVPSAHMSTNALHATAFSAKTWCRVGGGGAAAAAQLCWRVVQTAGSHTGAL